MIEISPQDIAVQNQVGELSLASDGDEAGGLKFLKMMRDSGGADWLASAQITATQGAAPIANLPQNLVPARVSQGLRDPMHLAV